MTQVIWTDAEHCAETLAHILGQDLGRAAIEELLEIGRVAADRERGVLEVGLLELDELEEAQADGVEGHAVGQLLDLVM